MLSISRTSSPINGHDVLDPGGDTPSPPPPSPPPPSPPPPSPPPPSPPPTASPLLPHHRAELRASGLTDETIDADGIYSITTAEGIANVLDWARPNRLITSGIAFPHYGDDGSLLITRIKPDRPRKLRGKTVKYESPRGQGNEVYVPRSARHLVGDASRPLLITEGEKKASAVAQAGYACIGLPGVWGAKSKDGNGLHPTVATLALRGREVHIVFDSDAARNPDIQRAEQWLYKRLREAGANVRVVRLPEAPVVDGKTPRKVGVDDYIVANGAEAFATLIAEANLDSSSSAVVQEVQRASDVDPAEEAKRFIHWHRIAGHSTVVSYRGTFWRWRNGRYQPLSREQLVNLIVSFSQPRISFMFPKFVDAVMMHLASMTPIDDEVDPPFWIGSTPANWDPQDLIACKTHIVHAPPLFVNEDHRLEASPNLFNLSSLDIEFRVDAPRPNRWFSFLESIWGRSPECISALQEWLGYLLTTDTSQQKILFLFGPKRSGKGTILWVMQQLVGQGNFCSPTLSSLSQNFGMWPLIGKSLALISDARLSGRSDWARIVEALLSISGEDAQTIDRKNLPPITLKLSTRLVIATNEIPLLKDVSGALPSRLIILPMTRTFFGHEDRKLKSALLPEIPGILIWALEGLRRLRIRGSFVEPRQAESLRTSLEAISSPTKQFLRDACEFQIDACSPKREIYDAYCRWARDGGSHPVNDATFGRDLIAAAPTIARTQRRINGLQVWCYQGIRLRHDGGQTRP
jgi:putative DNA primase/helicase